MLIIGEKKSLSPKRIKQSGPIFAILYSTGSPMTYSGYSSLRTLVSDTMPDHKDTQGIPPSSFTPQSKRLTAFINIGICIEDLKFTLQESKYPGTRYSKLPTCEQVPF